MLPFHAASLGALAGAGYHLYGRAMRKIEAGASADEPVLESDEATRWTGPTVSGGAGQPGAVGDPRPGGPPARADLRAAAALRATGRTASRTCPSRR